MRGLLVGRFQPFHGGHLALLRSVRERRPKEPVLIGIGSAQYSYTLENPFTAGERFEMIERALAEAGVSGCTPVPLPDIDRHAMWVAYLESLLPPFDRIYTNNPLTRALFEAAEYEVESPPLIDRASFEGSRIRELLASGGDWERRVPMAVRTYLTELRGPERLRLLRSAGPPRPGSPEP